MLFVLLCQAAAPLALAEQLLALARDPYIEHGLGPAAQKGFVRGLFLSGLVQPHPLQAKARSYSSCQPSVVRICGSIRVQPAAHQVGSYAPDTERQASRWLGNAVAFVIKTRPKASRKTSSSKASIASCKEAERVVSNSECCIVHR
jgi:hypothetical protein